MGKSESIRSVLTKYVEKKLFHTQEWACLYKNSLSIFLSNFFPLLFFQPRHNIFYFYLSIDGWIDDCL